MYSNATRTHILGWLFPTIGVPILVIGIELSGTSAKDPWILQGILPVFLAFAFLLGLSLILGRPELVVPNAAIAMGLLAIVPTLKYGFVYGEFDPIGHYSAALQIAQTGSLAIMGPYSAQYASTPLLHILLAMTGLATALPIEATIACTLFLENFVFLVVVADSVRRIFPGIDRRLIACLAIMTLPIIGEMVGTTYGLLAVAMFTYASSRIIGETPRRAYVFMIVLVMVALLFSHFLTATYLLLVATGYTISLLVMKRLGLPDREVASDRFTKLLPLFLICFLVWVAYVGQNYIYLVRDISAELFASPVLPSAAGTFPLTDLLQIYLFKYSRLLVAAVMAVGASFAVIRFRKTGIFLMFWWLLAGAILMGGLIGLGLSLTETWRSLYYVSLVAPYFLFILVSKGGHAARLLDLRRNVPKAIILVTLIMSIVAAYPITPLYPQSGGNPILDDNTVNTIYTISALRFFSSVYSSERVITTKRIFWQLVSLDPQVAPLAWNTISPGLDVASLADVKGELVVFDGGGRSGTANLHVRALAGDLRNTLGVIYSNGFFYVALAT